MFRYGREYDESTVKQIEGLLAEIHPDGSRNRQTADTILRTCRFYQGINSGNLTQVDNLLWDLDRNAYAPPHGFLDWPHMLHKLGVALWARFQLSMSLDDLDKSIALNKEALHLVPDKHCDQANIITCLGISFLRLLVARGDITDIDMSAGIVQLGEMVVRELDSIPSVGRATVSWQRLREQIKLMSAAHKVIPSIDRIGSSKHTYDTPTQCKQHLGILLSFLRGEGETKMRKLLATVKWSFKEHKIEETTQVLELYMPYFHSVIGLDLNWVDEIDCFYRYGYYPGPIGESRFAARTSTRPRKRRISSSLPSGHPLTRM